MAVTLVPRPEQNNPSPEKVASREVDGEVESASSLKALIDSLESLFKEAHEHCWTKGKVNTVYLTLC